MNRIFTTLLIILIFSSSFCSLEAQGHITHTESTGNYTELFLSYESARNLSADFRDGQVNYQVQGLRSNFSVMYPSRSLGFGIKTSYLRRFVETADGTGHNQTIHGWSDLQLVAKYHFGIYQRFHLAGKDRLFKAVVGLLARLKLPTASDDAKGLNGEKLPIPAQLSNGSTNLTLGFAMHTDTHKYFRIHSHFTVTFPVAHRSFRPGPTLHYMLDYTLVRMGLQERIYPFIGFKGWWKGADTWEARRMTQHKGNHLYLSSGLRSVWWYFQGSQMFLMTEFGFQLRLAESSKSTGSQIGLYLGTRLFWR